MLLPFRSGKEIKMKKFFTMIPLQVKGKLNKYHYTAVGNEKLEMERETAFPILTAVHGYVERGEAFEVVALMMDSEVGRYNFELFEEELKELCAEKGIVCASLKPIHISEGNSVSTHIETFQKLIEHVAEDDELFLCITFGTKPLSAAMKLAVQYAYRVKRNTTISCVVYGEVQRTSNDESTWEGCVYDETALLHLDEIVRKLAECRVENPEAMIRRILDL